MPPNHYNPEAKEMIYMTKVKSANDFIAEGDFEGAKEKFDKANSRWRGHWFNTCVTIAKQFGEWVTKYLIDPVNMTITAIGQYVKKRAPKVNEEESHVYLIEMYDEDGNHVYNKVGKANDLRQRLSTLSRQLYRRSGIQIARVEVIKTWTLATNHLAESFEQLLHSIMCKKYENIPNDRYTPISLSAEEVAEMDRIYAVFTSIA